MILFGLGIDQGKGSCKRARLAGKYLVSACSDPFYVLNRRIVGNRYVDLTHYGNLSDGQQSQPLRICRLSREWNHLAH